MTSNRAKYKERQDAFVRSIFESDEQELLRKSLVHKRSRTIAHYWPRLRKELGDEWYAEFEKHAVATAREFVDDAFVDGLRFAKYVSSRRKLGPDAMTELQAAERSMAFHKLSSLWRK